MSEHRAPCSTEHSEPGRESFRLSLTESGLRIETPSIFTRTYWTPEQATRLRDVLTELLKTQRRRS